jgi:hypothetical protein
VLLTVDHLDGRPAVAEELSRLAVFDRPERETMLLLVIQPSLDPRPCLLLAEGVRVVPHVVGVGLDLVQCSQVREVLGEGSQAEPKGEQLLHGHSGSVLPAVRWQRRGLIVSTKHAVLSGRDHLRVLLGAPLGALVGLIVASPFALSVGLSEAEGVQAAAIIAVAFATVGCMGGLAFAIVHAPHGWLIAIGTAIVLVLGYPLIRALLPDRDPIESLGTDTWVEIIVLSIIVVPQLVLVMVELVAHLRSERKAHVSSATMSPHSGSV